jgi:hypothetical protein
MKIYEIHVTFLEPAQATVTLHANSEEEAIEMLKKRLENEVRDLTFQEIKLVLEDNRPEVHSETNRTLN